MWNEKVLGVKTWGVNLIMDAFHLWTDNQAYWRVKRPVTCTQHRMGSK